jgi:acetyltransferase-like isoleucine patch superfamily enzyme
MQTIAWKYQLRLATVHKIILEICDLVWTVLAPIYLKAPETNEEWLRIAHDFYNKWNFPNCIGGYDSYYNKNCIMIICNCRSHGWEACPNTSTCQVGFAIF